MTSFEFKVKIFDTNQEIVLDTKFPPPNVTLLETDLDVLYYLDFMFVPSIQYKLDIEYTYENNKKNIIVDFVGTKPSKPFTSWVWKNTEWIAPVPLPNDAGDVMSGEMYEWDEQNKEWLPLGGYKIE